MTMCPNSKAACECQPQDGVMCPHGPTPNDWPTGTSERCILCNGTGIVDLNRSSIRGTCPDCRGKSLWRAIFGSDLF